MMTNTVLTIKEQIKKDFGVDLPILGGDGQSIDNPIIIDPKCKDWSSVEYSYVKLINQALGRSWKVVNTSLIEHNGHKIDQLKLAIDGDDENFYNYYFDVTDHV